MKEWDELREYRYNKAVARFCAVVLLAAVIVMCLVVR